MVSKDSDISHLLRLVNEAYINYSASGLSQKTHQPGSPWSLTDDGRIIKDQLIFDTFSNGLETSWYINKVTYLLVLYLGLTQQNSVRKLGRQSLVILLPDVFEETKSSIPCTKYR
ncbi:protein of unknown function [Lactobacillus delbrueckii subsp. delbrueckii]|uniref:Uncharacterized protein n=1 Tax=Lactobacillus delbrueckii subsp. delbrueckii TaxID=83684 RepID=A0AAU9R0X5_9LACO|nr:protein of unknown function [Lactobacillus delbrueckii subsp. delbrueckii]